MVNNSIEIGTVYGRLTVIRKEEVKTTNTKCGKRTFSQWFCECSCGNMVVVTTRYLKTRVPSCGCWGKEIKKSSENKYKTHGSTKTRLYKIWRSMIARCYNENHIHYNNYGGSGVTICDEWLNDFSVFKSWSLENGYGDNLSIDRIDGLSGYSPYNCRWATNKEQSRNTVSNVIVTSNDGEQKAMIEWCEFFELDKKGYHRAIFRFNKGMSFDEIFDRKKYSALPAKKQSGVKGIIWNKKAEVWVVKSIKNGKPDTYLKSFKKLKDAKDFLEEYNKKLKI